MSHLIFSILAFSTNFCPIKIDLSGSTVWPLASRFPKLAKLSNFGILNWTFAHSKCKRSLLRSQCWMRLFIWFLNTVTELNWFVVKCSSFRLLHFCLRYRIWTVLFWFRLRFESQDLLFARIWNNGCNPAVAKRLVVSGHMVSRNVVSLIFGLLDIWTFGHLVFGTNELLDMWSCRLLDFRFLIFLTFDLLDIWAQMSEEQRSKSPFVQKAKCLEEEVHLYQRPIVQKSKCPKDQMSKRPHVSRPRVQRPQVYLSPVIMLCNAGTNSSKTNF